MNERPSILGRDKLLATRTLVRNPVVQNAASLYLVQFGQYILPLITVPYLVRVLGPAGFGAVAFGQSLLAYFNYFIDYGFSLSAPREISVERDDTIAVSRTVFNVWVARAFLCVVGFVILLLIISIVPKLREIRALLFILYGATVGNMLFPLWLFQGLEKLVFVSFINLVMQLYVTIGIFTMIHQPGDNLLYAGLISTGSIGTCIVGIGAAFLLFRLHPIIPSWKGIWQTLVGGRMLFLSTASVGLFTVGNPFILGLFANHTAVGYYSAAEKFIYAGFGLFGPIVTAAYPRLSKLASVSKPLTLFWARRVLLLMSSLGLFLSICLFMGARLLVHLIFGPEYEPSIKVLRIMASILFLISITHVLGHQVMLSFGKDRAYTAILLCGGLINITLAIMFAPAWQASGMAISFLMSQIFVTVGMIIYCKVRGISPIFRNQ